MFTAVSEIIRYMINLTVTLTLNYFLTIISTLVTKIYICMWPQYGIISVQLSCLSALDRSLLYFIKRKNNQTAFEKAKYYKTILEKNVQVGGNRY